MGSLGGRPRKIRSYGVFVCLNAGRDRQQNDEFGRFSALWRILRLMSADSAAGQPKPSGFKATRDFLPQRKGHGVANVGGSDRLHWRCPCPCSTNIESPFRPARGPFRSQFLPCVRRRRLASRSPRTQDHAPNESSLSDRASSLVLMACPSPPPKSRVAFPPALGFLIASSSAALSR